MLGLGGFINCIDNGSDSERMKSVDSVAESVENGLYSLIASALIYAEVLESKMSEATKDKFSAFMKNRKKVQVTSVSIPVAKKVREIRDRVLQNKGCLSKKISTADAVHIPRRLSSGQIFPHLR